MKFTTLKCAVGGGSGIALCADIVIMEERARIGYMPARAWGCPTTAMRVYRLGAEQAEAMAHAIARFPQACMRADRRSVYTQHGLSLRDAMRKEWYNGVPAFAAEGAVGAARFASGKGRHGNFGDL